jgi:hypothetical protein
MDPERAPAVEENRGIAVFPTPFPGRDPAGQNCKGGVQAG